MAEELASLYSNLNIDDDADSIVDLGEVNSNQANDKVELMLVGRLLTSRSINFDAFKRTMTQAWNLYGRVIIRVIDTNLYAFQLFHWRDKEKILEGGPWCFDQQLLILNTITGNEQPHQVSLSHSSFWVRIYNLPFNCRSNEDVRAITEHMGELVEIEDDDYGLDRCRRVKLRIDVTKPLRRNQRIRNKNGDVVRIEFKYERLPFFCFLCGRMGHSEKECNYVAEDQMDKGLGWGVWIKASPRRGRTREKEELKAMGASRRSLFVCKKQSEASLSNVEGKTKEDDNEITSQNKPEQSCVNVLTGGENGGGVEAEVQGVRSSLEVSLPQCDSSTVANMEEKGTQGQFLMGWYSAGDKKKKKYTRKGHQSRAQSIPTDVSTWEVNVGEQSCGGRSELGDDVVTGVGDSYGCKRKGMEADVDVDMVDGGVADKRIKVSLQESQVAEMGVLPSREGQ